MVVEGAFPANKDTMKSIIAERVKTMELQRGRGRTLYTGRLGRFDCPFVCTGILLRVVRLLN